MPYLLLSTTTLITFTEQSSTYISNEGPFYRRWAAACGDLISGWGITCLVSLCLVRLLHDGFETHESL